MKPSRLFLTLLAVGGWLLIALPVRAQVLPPVNLGATSFLDGGVPAGPGLYSSTYLQYFGSGRFRDNAGNTAPLPSPHLNVWSELNQLIYLADYDVPLLGAKPALDVMLPVVSTESRFGAPGPFPRDNGLGLGDLLIGPALQFNPIMGENGPLFVMRLEAQCNFSTGKYSNDREINPGAGFFSFDPYWAGTLFLGPKLEVSLRAHYLWNASTKQPSDLLGVNSARAGEAFHINFATSYEVLEKRLRVGLNGYYLKQTTDSELDGFTVPGRDQVLGLGPGFLWFFNETNQLFFNSYFETDVRNRPEGSRFTLRYVTKF